MNNTKENSVTATQLVISGLSLLLVLMLLGFILYAAITETERPPIISVYKKNIFPADQKFIVEFTAKNTGSTTAKNVEIEGAIMEGGKEFEKSTATIDFVPAHAERRGGLIFTRDPRPYRLEIRPKGYDRP